MRADGDINHTVSERDKVEFVWLRRLLLLVVVALSLRHSAAETRSYERTKDVSEKHALTLYVHLYTSSFKICASKNALTEACNAHSNERGTNFTTPARYRAVSSTT